MRDAPVRADAHADEAWDPSMDPETVRVAYEEAAGLQPLLAGWADAMDAKAVAIFGIGAVILTVAPIFTSDRLHGLALILWMCAAGLWAIGAYRLASAYAPDEMEISPNLKKTLGRDWLSLSAPEYRYWRLADMRRTYSSNHAFISRKGKALSVALMITLGEVLLLALALLAAQF